MPLLHVYQTKLIQHADLFSKKAIHSHRREWTKNGIRTNLQFDDLAKKQEGFPSDILIVRTNAFIFDLLRLGLEDRLASK